MQVLPFEPLNLTFHHLNYYVPLTKVGRAQLASQLRPCQLTCGTAVHLAEPARDQRLQAGRGASNQKLDHVLTCAALTVATGGGGGRGQEVQLAHWPARRQGHAAAAARLQVRPMSNRHALVIRDAMAAITRDCCNLICF